MSKIIFSTEAYSSYVNQIFQRIDNARIGELYRKVFPDGEVGYRFMTNVRDEDVILIGGTWNVVDTMEIYDLGCAISKHGARSLTLVVPYFGCSTMERATKDGEVVTAKTRARLLSAIPQTHAGNRALLLDLHSEGISHYFEGSMTATHVYAKYMIYDMVKGLVHEFGNDGNYVLASTDAGRAKWVESLSVDLSVPAAFIIKRRESGTTTKVLAVSADVKGKMVVLYDDMIRTGGSLLEAAKAYRAAGASMICAIATHGVLPGDSLEKLYDSNEFTHIAVTDSHPSAMNLDANAAMLHKSVSPFFSVHSCSEMFIPWLK